MKGLRPNILWICTDQQRYDTIGALGNPHVDTPNINRLVAEGGCIDPCVLPKPYLHAEQGEFFDRAIRECRACKWQWQFAFSRRATAGHQNAIRRGIRLRVDRQIAFVKRVSAH